MADAIRVLAEGHVKFSVLTTPPADPRNPTVAELNAGIDASCKVAREGFSWTNADSDTVDDTELCSTSKAQAPGADNAELSFTVYRYYMANGGADPQADSLYNAVKAKGTVLYGYVRISDKLATTAWAADDEVHLGAEFWTDWPQYDTGTSGWQKFKVPCHANKVYPMLKVKA